MSLLYRTGNGRNNIAWGGSTSTAATYLRRTSIGRNDISYINISSNGTYNILNRTGTGRNNISWINTIFNFGTNLSGYPLYSRTLTDGYTTYNVEWVCSGTRSGFIINTINRNGYSNISETFDGDHKVDKSIIRIFYQKGLSQSVYNEIMKSTGVTIFANNTSYYGKFGTDGRDSVVVSRGEISNYPGGEVVYSRISLECGYIINPGRFPTLQSITFS